jgi:hypothetical protein
VRTSKQRTARRGVELRAELSGYVSRVGSTPREQLAWAIRLAEDNPGTATPPDWENRRGEIAAFVCQHDDHEWLAPVGQRFAAPTEDEARQIQRRLGEVIAKVIARDRHISFGPVRMVSGILWREDLGRYQTWAAGPGWERQAIDILGRLLVEHGHLVKECPAPAPRGSRGTSCGKWFVASRPRQDYCSARCQSRATTRAYRQRAPAPRRARGFRQKSRHQQER